MGEHVAHAVFALVTAGVGLVASASAGIWAAVGDGGGNISPWVQVGGTSVAVSALAYVAKLLADGRLVAQPIAELLTAADRRERDVAKLAERSLEREDRLLDLLMREQR